MQLRLLTSRYQNPLLATGCVVPVGITAYPPRWRLPYPVAARVKELAPLRALLKVHDRAVFEPQYLAQLDALGVAAILARLAIVAAPGDGRPLALLCFEALREPGAWCHRRTFAAWWEQQTGQAVPELTESLDAAQALIADPTRGDAPR